MSENLLSTIFYGVVSIVVAVISAVATIRSAEINVQAKTRSRKSKFFTVVYQRLFVALLIFSLISIVFFFSQLTSMMAIAPSLRYKTIDLGSMTTVKEDQYNEKEQIVVYAHHPASNIKYNSLTFLNGSLIKVEKQCGFSNSNITNLFSANTEFQNFVDQQNPNFDLRAYIGSEVDVSGNCTIYFFVQNDMKSFISIWIESEYLQ